MKSVADACNLLQRNSLINWIHIAVLDKEIEIEFGNQRTLVEAQNQLFSLCVTDHLMSSMFGRVVQNKGLHKLGLSRYLREDVNGLNDESIAAEATCTHVFFEEVKHNKSIVNADLDLMCLRINALSEFILN